MVRNSRKIDILFIHHSGNFGGAPKSLSYIIKNIDRTKYTPKLINVASGPINDFFSKSGIDVKIVSGIKVFHGSTVVPKKISVLIRNYLFFLPSVINSFFLLKKEKPDLIHLNSTCLLSVGLAAKFLNIPVVCHVREPIRKGIWGWPLKYFNKWSVTGFIAISEFDLNSLGELGHIKSTVIYNFVDKFSSGKRRNNIRHEYGIPDDGVVFLYLARFAKGNGWKELIKIAEVVNRKFDSSYFVLAGRSQDVTLPTFESDRIFIRDFSPEVDDLLLNADVFICPFTEPHFARGVIEASAFSLPVLASNVGGVNELVVHGKTGFLYNSDRDFLNFSEILISDSSLRIELGKKGYKFAFERFNLEENLKDTLDFFELVLNVS